MITLPYIRENATAYAKEWAYKRNPIYTDFDEMGGDCTNFISQCLFSGGNVMNYQKTFGWYYTSLNSRAPAWTSVEHLHHFLITNQNVGPVGMEVPLSQIELGDIIQFSHDGNTFTHSTLVTYFRLPKTKEHVYLSAHTFDVYNKRMSDYAFSYFRAIKILHFNK